MLHLNTALATRSVSACSSAAPEALFIICDQTCSLYPALPQKLSDYLLYSSASFDLAMLSGTRFHPDFLRR